MRRLLLGIVLGVGLFFSMAHTAFAFESQLKQEIFPGECVLTTVTNGIDHHTIAQCPTDTPTITELTTTNAGARIIKGVVDASRIKALSILFRGVVYHASDPQSPLTVVGDSWFFAIDAVLPVVPEGDYTVTITALTLDDRVLSSTQTLSVPSPVSVTPDPGPHPQKPSNATQGVLPNETSGVTLDLLGKSPVHIERGVFGGVRIWIDEGAGVQRTALFAPSLFAIFLVGIAILGGVTGVALVVQCIVVRTRR